jgi:hypothetical protein
LKRKNVSGNNNYVQTPARCICNSRYYERISLHLSKGGKLIIFAKWNLIPSLKNVAYSISITSIFLNTSQLVSIEIQFPCASFFS